MFEENKETCRRILEQGFGAGNLKTVDDLVSLKCKIHDPAFPGLQPGADSLKRHIRGLRDAFPNLTCSCDDVIAERNEVVIHWTSRGTQRGEFLNHSATNRPVIISGTSIFRLEANKIAEMWTDWNVQSLLDQLGIGMTDLEANKALVSRFLEEVWNRRKPELIDQVVADKCIRTSPAGVTRGPAGYRKEYDGFMAALPDFHLKIEEISSEGERVTVRFTGSGTQQGRLFDIAPSGRHLTFPGLSLYHVMGGKIVEAYVSYDQLGIMQQVTIPASGAHKTRGAE